MIHTNNKMIITITIMVLLIQKECFFLLNTNTMTTLINTNYNTFSVTCAPCAIRCSTTANLPYRAWISSCVCVCMCVCERDVWEITHTNARDGTTAMSGVMCVWICVWGVALLLTNDRIQTYNMNKLLIIFINNTPINLVYIPASTTAVQWFFIIIIHAIRHIHMDIIIYTYQHQYQYQIHTKQKNTIIYNENNTHRANKTTNRIDRNTFDWSTHIHF